VEPKVKKEPAPKVEDDAVGNVEKEQEGARNVEKQEGARQCEEPHSKLFECLEEGEGEGAEIAAFLACTYAPEDVQMTSPSKMFGAPSHVEQAHKMAPSGRPPASHVSLVDLLNSSDSDRVHFGPASLDCLGFQVSNHSLSLDCMVGLAGDGGLSDHDNEPDISPAVSPHGGQQHLTLSGLFPCSSGGANNHPWRDASRSPWLKAESPLPATSASSTRSPWQKREQSAPASTKPFGWENLLPSDHDIIRLLAATSP